MNPNNGYMVANSHYAPATNSNINYYSQSLNDYGRSIQTNQQQRPIVTSIRPQQQVVTPAEYQLTLLEIRFGKKKYEVTNYNSKLTFKNDGVLFHIAVDSNDDYSPVLINSKSIIKATLNPKLPLPVIFLHLEGSSIKQLKEIFKLKDNEFINTATAESRRCISFFLKPIELTFTIQKTVCTKFIQMKKEIGRVDDILVIITPAQALDLLLETEGNFNEWLQKSPKEIQITSPTPVPVIAQRPLVPNTVHNVLPKTPLNRVYTNAAESTKNIIDLVSMHSEVILPENQAERLKIYNSLKQNGIYRVKDGSKSYIGIWNGSTFTPLPCYVESVNFFPKHIHCGSLVINCDKNDQIIISTTKISLKFTYNEKKIDLIIEQTKIVSIKALFKNDINIFILEFGPSAIRDIQNTFMMKYQYEPYFSNITNNEQHKHFVICLNSVTQKDKNAVFEMDSKRLPNTKLVKVITEDTVKHILSIVHNTYMEDEDDDLIIGDVEIPIKCPYSQKIMKDPVMNLICQHNYEKQIITDFMKQKAIKCPSLGCDNKETIHPSHLEDNIELKDYIERLQNI